MDYIWWWQPFSKNRTVARGWMYSEWTSKTHQPNSIWNLRILWRETWMDCCYCSWQLPSVVWCFSFLVYSKNAIYKRYVFRILMKFPDIHHQPGQLKAAIKIKPAHPNKRHWLASSFNGSCATRNKSRLQWARKINIALEHPSLNWKQTACKNTGACRQ